MQYSPLDRIPFQIVSRIFFNFSPIYWNGEEKLDDGMVLMPEPIHSKKSMQGEIIHLRIKDQKVDGKLAGTKI
jgi:hypothetical protein